MTAHAHPRSDGSVLIRSDETLAAYPRSIVDAIAQWAEKTPDALMVADRDGGEDWRRLSYREVMDAIPPLAQALLDAGLSPERPLVILSGNEIEHLLLGLASIWVGIPYSPISPAYSLISTDYGKLRHIAGLLTPGMVYASDGARFAPAVAAVFAEDVPLVVKSNPPARGNTRLFSDLANTSVTPAVAAAHENITPDTVAKVLFTSGSTGMPKGVITTNRMMACNQEMIRTALAFLKDEPPVMLDWMPWNHVAGSSHNTGIAFYNGGSFYIDDGQPTPEKIGRTLRNLRDVQPTISTNVPKGYEFLVAAFDEDPEIRRNFFARMKLVQYAGASLSQHVFEGLDRSARAELGQRVMIITGYGSTETAPFAFTTTWPVEEAGHIGLPAAGIEVKLVPNGDKQELRLKGPNVTPGYWRDAEKTAEAFDEEGFYCIGDAIKPANPGDLSKGFVFDGRVSEDFKLSTGTWVNFANVRKSVIAACAPLIRDVVLTGADRNHLGALIFPDLEACARHAGVPVGTDAATILAHPAVADKFAQSLRDLALNATGSSNHVARAQIVAVAPDIDKGEVTDKGSINQRAVLAARKDLLEALYTDPVPAGVLDLPRKGK
ncbi:feruloyl-CoA synthase [Pelagibacterium sp. H642]|uniref:feruloyl-CoA synthase n=1 Tax=Pelagibacterium sp. H642 TaxID=1881069 RepID=UPI002815F310|nr:feruloyl-CoA synthase [Pelagibacterium sp. H642]WMT91271.1 feruloyl-CoA synthase [Pelagibacterium sp. H642]